MAEIEIGFLGKLIGSQQAAPGSIAFSVIIIAFLAMMVSGIADVYLPEQSVIWSKVITAMISLISTALGFIFGRGSQPHRSQ